MKPYMKALAAAAALLFLPQATALAGGPISVSRTAIYGADPSMPYQAYLGYPLDTASYTNQFHNTDSVPITVVGDGWQVGPIAPDAYDTHTFNDPGTYAFHLAEAPSLTGTIIMLNEAPAFPDGQQMSATSVGSTEATLQWPVLQDDGPNLYYKMYVNGTLYTDTTATSATVRNLSPGTLYTFRVDGFDNAGLQASTSPVLSVRTVENSTPKPTAKPATTATPAPAPAQATPIPDTATPATPSPLASPPPTASPDLATDISGITVNGTPAAPSETLSVTGDTISLSGTASPGAKVTITLHSTPLTYETYADANGSWTKTIPLSGLERGSHTAYVRYETAGVAGPQLLVARFSYAAPLNMSAIIFGSTAGIIALGVAGIIFMERRRRASAPLR